MSDERIIYHIVAADYYNNLPADQPYLPPRFAEEGFIHCTRGEDRVLLVANTLYRKTPGQFLLLVIDERRVQAEIRNEIVGEILFPHIYGPLNRDAIVRVQEMARAADGTFLPIGEPPQPVEPLSLHPAVTAAQASLEDVLAETRRLRKYATQRIAELEQEIEAFRQGKPYTPPPAPAVKVPAQPVSATAPTDLEALAERVARLEQQLIDTRSLLVDRMDKLEAHLAALAKKCAADKRSTAPTKTARKNVKR